MYVRQATRVFRGGIAIWPKPAGVSTCLAAVACDFQKVKVRPGKPCLLFFFFVTITSFALQVKAAIRALRERAIGLVVICLAAVACDFQKVKVRPGKPRLLFFFFVTITSFALQVKAAIRALRERAIGLVVISRAQRIVAGLGSSGAPKPAVISFKISQKNF